MAQKALDIVREHELQFDVEWLKDAVGWIEKNEVVTDRHITAIWNVLTTVKKMVHWKKQKERKN